MRRIAPHLLAVALALVPAIGTARAQDLVADLRGEADEPLYLEADTLTYDTRTRGAVASGNVYIAYRGYQLFADEVTYDDPGNRLAAAGGVRLEEPNGNVVVARNVDLSDDLADGFLTALRVDTIYRTRFAADSAQRIGDSVTIFQDAGYTACWSCRRRPNRPPTWAIQSRRVIYDEAERTLTFEEPQFDLFGASIGPLPTFSIPDPTVRRRSGLLTPTAIYSNLIGFGVRVPYFQTLGPSADLTVAATPLTRQGLFGDAIFRQRTANGIYSVRGAGIYQLDPGAFDDTSGDRKLRGAVRSRGRFDINPFWQWGWETTVTTDRSFLSDYKQDEEDNLTAPSTLFLTGLGSRNYLDARLWGFRILQEDYRSREVLNPPSPFSGVGQDLQRKQAFVHPAIDYEGVLGTAVLGGEVSWRLNTIALSRAETDAFGTRTDFGREARFRGVEGTFARASAEVDYRRRMIGPLGTVLTPFAGVRGDLFAYENRDADVAALEEDDLVGRLMPHAGATLSWPFLITAPWGTQTIEPIGELIARPDEMAIGDLPNEDAQSVVFDTTNLFGPTKFSGYDRVEGGIRANVGLRYTVQNYSGGFLSAMVGQSYHLAGRNSYIKPDILDAASGSGLQSDVSDWVADVTIDTNSGFALSAKGRFDEADLTLQRAELSAAARTGPLSTQVIYAFLNEEPDLGFTEDREEVHGSASLRVFDRVRAFGTVRYDLQDRDVIRHGAGLAYDDDALSVSLAYSEDRGGMPDDPIDRTIFFRVGLRTIGDANLSSGLDN